MKKGTLTTLGGSIYKGEFRNGKLHGKGTFIFSERSKQQGKWRYGEFIGK